MDVLLLLVEESKYADRIRNDIVHSEIPRPPLVVTGRKRHYNRPKSRTTIVSTRTPIESIRSSVRERTGLNEIEFEYQVDEYTNPAIDTSRRVNDDEALYIGEEIDLKYTMNDLKMAARGKKKISVRELRAIASKWGLDYTVKKPDLIRNILAEYRHRAGTSRNSSTNG